MKGKKQSSQGNENVVLQGNHITLDELAQIEELAHRSHSYEADIILRLAAALREAMQISANSLALMSVFKTHESAAEFPKTSQKPMSESSNG